MPTPSLFADQLDLAAAGVDLGSCGFERAGDRDPAVPVPEITTMSVDLWSRHDIDFIDTTHEDPAEWSRLTGSVFTDAHPDEFWNATHDAGWLTVFIGDPAPFITSKWPQGAEGLAWVSGLWMGQLPLVLRAWSDGVGSARSDQ